MRFSQRSAFDIRPNRLSDALRAARAKGRELLDLTVSNPTTAGLPYDVEAIVAPLADPAAARYAPEPFGDRTAREAVGEVYGVAPERVLLTASTSEAYAMLLDVLADPGERVLAPAPSYPLLSHLAALSGVGLGLYALCWDRHWRIDPEDLRRSVTPDTRAIIAVSPNNPTGSILDESDLAALDATGLPLIIDEVFGSYALEGKPRSAYTREHPRIVVGGLSKLAALPQMKVGWILVGGDDTFALPLIARLEVALDAHLSLSTPAQLALPRWLEGRFAVTDAIRTRTQHNSEALRDAIGESSPISVPRVDAGWYACLRVPATENDEQWALRLLDADGVLVQPGYFYDFTYGQWLVVSLLTEPDVFGEGVSRLAERIADEA